MSLRRVVRSGIVLCLSAWMTVAAVASEYHGQVTFSGLPLPGSTVTVTATQGDKKAIAVSDDQGVFAFPDLADGTWTLTIDMTGFQPLKQEVTIAPNAQPATFELKLLSLDQIRAEDKPVKVDTTQLASAPAISEPAAAVGGGTAKAAAAGKTAPAAAGAPPPAPDVQSQQASDGILINGSQSNAATSQFSMNQAFGNNRNSHSLYNGSVYATLENSSLDAAEDSLSGQPEARPQFNNYSLGFNLGGPLNIKRLMPRGPYFRINYSHSENNTYQALNALLPTGEVLSGPGTGNWALSGGPVYVPSDLAMFASTQCNAILPTATQIDPTNGTGKRVFTNNVIPSQCVANASSVLYGKYPQTPNVTGDSAYNYQVPQNTATASDTIGLSLQKQFGNKNNVNGRWNFLDTRVSNANPNIFNFFDTSATLGMNGNVGWYHSFTQRLRSSLTYSFGRQRSELVPSFSNIESVAGITASNMPQYQGPPELNFASSITGLGDGISSYNRKESNGIAVDMTWNRMRHTVEFGGGFSRLEFNYRTQSNPDGTFGFTGAATQASIQTTSGGVTTTQLVGGSDLADFLLGIPDTSAIAYGKTPDKYLRQSTYNLYVVDDFRVNPELSINAGLRWEYGSPVTELNGNLVNLSIGQNFSSITPVTGSNPLVHPDYSRPEPRIGIAWRPISGSSLLIHSGYGITNDTSVYQQAAYAMSQQFPVATSFNLENGTGCPLSLANAFPSGCSQTPDTFAMDPNFRVGYVQTWNLQVQRDLPFSMQMVATYTGIKGTHGVQELLPNTCSPLATSTASTCSSNPAGYIYRTSNGNLEREAGSLQVRRRLRNGLEAGVTYTFAKSLDDDYSLGAQGSVTNGAGIAQNWTDLRGQRGLSTTDQRNLVNVTAQYTTGMGLGGKAMLSGWRGAIYKDWTIQTVFSAGSGQPETPIYAGATIQGASFGGTIRPDLVGSPYANLVPGHFLNPNAYAVPTSASGFGNARRDSIEGPDTFSLNAAMLRTFRLHGRYSLDAQLQATNVLNHVVYTAWNTYWIPPAASSSTSTTPTPASSFGAPLTAGAMRSVSLSLRMRF